MMNQNSPLWQNQPSQDLPQTAPERSDAEEQAVRQNQKSKSRKKKH